MPSLIDRTFSTARAFVRQWRRQPVRNAVDMEEQPPTKMPCGGAQLSSELVNGEPATTIDLYALLARQQKARAQEDCERNVNMNDLQIWVSLSVAAETCVIGARIEALQRLQLESGCI